MTTLLTTPDANRQRKQDAVFALVKLLEDASDPGFTGEVAVIVTVKRGKVRAVKTEKTKKEWGYPIGPDAEG
jgi:hypothetical protein